MRLGRWQLLIALILAGWLTAPARGLAWWNDDWQFRKPITVDPGGLVPSDGELLLLVRLHSGNFDFLAAKDDGSDLRFVAGDDATPLTFHIERYDSLFELGLIWVRLPLTAPAPQTIFLYFGQPEATTAGGPAGSFAATTRLAYHFAEAAALPQDSTAYGNTATASTTLKAPAFIGQGLAVDGMTVVGLPASPSLDVAPGSGLTWQAWVRLDRPQPGAILFERAATLDPSGGGLVIGVDGSVPFVTVGGQRLTGTASLATGTWQHLALTAGRQLTLYLDGRPTGSLATPLPALTGPAQLGRGFPQATAPVPTPPPVPSPGATAPAPPPAAATLPPPPAAGFAGMIDELRIQAVERAPADMALTARAEDAASSLLAFGVDEEPAGLDLGHFGPIVRAVTVDGWVVIAICGVLMLVSWVVMIAKARYVRAVSRGNRAFIRVFQRLGLNVLGLEQIEAEAAAQRSRPRRRAYADAPLYHLYQVGTEEVERRINGANGKAAALAAGAAKPHAPASAAPSATGLSSQAIGAIKATLDAVLTRELQRANRLMVVLTIAIAGGPFLGLLGTVVGVMITFAAVAESGQVNINAIAPGIAAALLATVAGLVVAIPALFAYNYLIGQIRDISTDMQVFVDEFTSRIAEQYS